MIASILVIFNSLFPGHPIPCSLKYLESREVNGK
jgi:hypothetical protein